MLKIFKNILISALSTIVLILVIDGITRVGAALITGNINYAKWGFIDKKTLDFSKQQIEVYDGYFKMKKNKIYDKLKWTGKPMHTNQFGFRGKDFKAAPTPGTVRIITLGESSTFC